MKMVCKRCSAPLVLIFDCLSGTPISANTGKYDLDKASPITAKRGFHVSCEAGHHSVGYYYETNTGLIKDVEK